MYDTCLFWYIYYTNELIMKCVSYFSVLGIIGLAVFIGSAWGQVRVAVYKGQIERAALAYN